MNYRRLRPDFSDDTDQPITGSYLVDLDTLFHGHPLGNSGRVAEQMVFAFIRVLRCMDQYENLVLFLETVLDRKPPLLHFLDGLADQYLRRKIHGQTHKTAFETVTEVSHLKMPELRRDTDSDWVHIQDHSPRPYNDCTLPAAETRYVSAVLHLPKKFVLTCTGFPLSNLKAKFPSRSISPKQPKYPPRLQLVEKT